MHLHSPARWKFSRHINSWFCGGGDLARNSFTRGHDRNEKCLPQASCILHPASSPCWCCGSMRACKDGKLNIWKIFSAFRVRTLHSIHLPASLCPLTPEPRPPTRKWHGIRFFSKNLQRLCIFASPSRVYTAVYVYPKQNCGILGL